jgi:hypothetical protein
MIFSPLAPPPPPSALSHQYAHMATHRKTEKEGQLADGRGAKSYDDDKTLFSIKHSILSGYNSEGVKIKK